MSPPPKKKQRGSGLLQVFLKTGDWKSLKNQLLKIVDKLTNLSERIATLENQQGTVASADQAGSLTPELYKALQNLLVPVIGETLTRVNSRNYTTEYTYQNIQIFRNGQEVTVEVTLDGNRNVQFPTDVGESESVTATYSRKIT